VGAAGTSVDIQILQQCLDFILQDALFKNENSQENVGLVKIVACNSKLLTR
jgi:hypothetical protein